MDILLPILAVLFLRSNNCYAYFNLAGPYEFVIDGLTDCENVGSGLVRHNFRVHKVNSTTRLLQGRADFKIPIGENLSYKLQVERWTSGGWGHTYNMEGKDFCSMAHNAFTELFEALYNALGIPLQCPIPAGTYDTESGMELAYENFRKFPSLEYGRYKTEINFFTGEEVVGCLEISARIEEVAARQR